MATRNVFETVVVACHGDLEHAVDTDDTTPEYSSEVGTGLYAKPTLGRETTRFTCSSPPKRSWLWSDDEDEDEELGSGSDCGSERKRVKLGSLSPISSGRSSIGSLDVPPHLPRSRDDFLAFCTTPGTVFVDKTDCILNLPSKFRYLLLRPPRFGKTAFLSTLHYYYDIHGAPHFPHRFGSLAVAVGASNSTPHSAPPHSQHLCLSFDLAHILVVYSDLPKITSQLTLQTKFILDLFLIKYATELDLSDPSKLLRNETETGDMFRVVFERVKEHGYTLFVGVDNYDSPTYSRSWTCAEGAGDKCFAAPRQIEQLLDSLFWGPLMAGAYVIDKLLVTGTLLLKYLNLESLTVHPGLQNAYGFTEQEALHLTHSLLGENAAIPDLPHLCGEYAFSSPAADGRSPVFHPQLLIDRLRELSLYQPCVDEDTFRLLSNFLLLLPEESDGLDSLTSSDLIELLATGAISVSGKMDSPFDFDNPFTWSALYSAGALTYDRELTDTLRVANSSVLSLIHSRVDDLFAARHRLQWVFLNAWHDFSKLGRPRLFLDMLTGVLRDLAQRSFGKKHEPSLRGIFELVMRNSHCSNPSRPIHPIILLPADVHCVTIPAYERGVTVTVELKTLTLRGMWRATNLNDDEAAAEALETLHKELVELDEEALLARPYRVWSHERNAMETVLVGSFFDPKPKVPQLLAVGGARILLRASQPEEPNAETEEADADNADADNEADDEADDEAEVDDEDDSFMYRCM
ncbi:hypothetical protein C8R47DRAFT_463486 [Mycena vitilis]|nr:hypothetical protein C8R47DRAFT_463486 [Mycena vitilis]